MRRHLMAGSAVVAVVAATGLTGFSGRAGAAPASVTDHLVTNGSPRTTFPQNKQNEPGLALDPAAPSTLVAGSNDEIDLGPCAGSSCPFTPGVGVSGVYFSFNGGSTWTQPRYTGYSDRTGTPVRGGPIGTLPNYFEAGLASDGNAELAFGPRPNGHGGFTYDRGSRLYYANLAANFPGTSTTKGFEAVTVSHADDLAAAAAGSNAAWSAPVVESKQNGALSSDKESIFAERQNQPLLRQRVRLQRRLPRAGEEQRSPGAGAHRPIHRRWSEFHHQAGHRRDRQQPDRRSTRLHAAHRQPRQRSAGVLRVQQAAQQWRVLPGSFPGRRPELQSADGGHQDCRHRPAGTGAGSVHH